MRNSTSHDFFSELFQMSNSFPIDPKRILANKKKQNGILTRRFRKILDTPTIFFEVHLETFARWAKNVQLGHRQHPVPCMTKQTQAQGTAHKTGAQLFLLESFFYSHEPV